jgi:hypothetical protein
MLRFLFWNAARADLRTTLSRLVTAEMINIAVIAECAIPSYELSKELSTSSGREFFVPYSNSARITLLSDVSARFFSPVAEGNRFSIQALHLPGKEELLLAAVHLPSKRDMSDQSQHFECYKLADEIRSAETVRKHERTLLVGDFNMNPFEAGMVAAGGIHGVMSRETALRANRTVQGAQYPFFYNPMWSLFGDYPSGPPGTMYYERAEDVCYFWSLFDQVLLRPTLISHFDSASLRVLTEAGGKTLVSTKGRPLKEDSDHLPIVFSLQL